jgi:hypothetical protein
MILEASVVEKVIKCSTEENKFLVLNSSREIRIDLRYKLEDTMDVTLIPFVINCRLFEKGSTLFPSDRIRQAVEPYINDNTVIYVNIDFQHMNGVFGQDLLDTLYKFVELTYDELHTKYPDGFTLVLDAERFEKDYYKVPENIHLVDLP